MFYFGRRTELISVFLSEAPYYIMADGGVTLDTAHRLVKNYCKSKISILSDGPKVGVGVMFSLITRKKIEKKRNEITRNERKEGKKGDKSRKEREFVQILVDIVQIFQSDRQKVVRAGA